MKRISYNRYIDGKLPPGTKLVTRPSRFSNPYHLAEHGREEALRLFKIHLDDQVGKGILNLEELRGFDLACICPMDEKCHVDIILDKMK
jgi:hypothetical protein